MLKPNTHNSHSMCPRCSLEASTQSDRTTFDTFTREATQENTTALINPNAKFSAVPPVCKGPGDAGFFVITRLLVRLPCIDSRVKCVTQTDRKRLQKDKRQSGGEAPPPTVLSCPAPLPLSLLFSILDCSGTDLLISQNHYNNNNNQKKKKADSEQKRKQ